MALGKPRIVSISDAAESAEEKAQVEAAWASRAVEVAEDENGGTGKPESTQAPPWVARNETKRAESAEEKKTTPTGNESEEGEDAEEQQPSRPETPEELAKRKEKEAEIARLLGEVKASAEQQRELQKQEDENKTSLPAGPQERPKEMETHEKKAESEPPVQPLPEETKTPETIGEQKEEGKKKPRIVETRDYSLIAGAEKQQTQPGQATPGVSLETPASESALDKFRRLQKPKDANPLTLENLAYKLNGILTDIGKKFKPKSEQ